MIQRFLFYSSNSQLFKNSGDSSSSSAIPLTFNNSIAEVLAAAAKSKSRELAGQTGNTSKPEVTITAKSVNKTVNKTVGPMITPKPHTATASSSSATKEVTSKSNKTNPKLNPLMDMSKLLQNQAPGIAPHIIAQNTLAMPTTASNLGSLVSKPVSTHQLAGTMPKIAPKPVSSLLKPVPVVSKASGIQTVNKKSLTTVLDRLSGLKGSSSSSSVTPSSSVTASISSPASNSSLVQQLQAPPMMTNPGLSSPNKSRNNPVTNSGVSRNNPVTNAGVSNAVMSNAGASSSSLSAPNMSSNAALQQGLQAMLASQNLLGMGFPGASGPSGLVGQPMGQLGQMGQYPWPSSTPAQQQAALAEAQRALTMAGAGLPGMNQAAAAAALHELMKMSLQAQHSKPSGQRLRAPPPLTHMGRPGGGPNPNKPKNPE